MKILAYVRAASAALLNRVGLNRELDDEIRSHIAMHADDLERSGLSRTEAERRARIAFGGRERFKEECRDALGGRLVESIWQDIRFALRMLRKSPGFTAVAILTLALGIGANAGMFSIVNTLLLRSLPFREPDRLVLLQNFVPPADTARQFHDWGRQREYFADAAAFEDIDANLSGGRGVIRAHISQTSWNFFSILGTQPILGHGFAPEDDVDASGLGLPGRNAIAVISYGLWQELFGGDPKALGATIRVEGNPLTVVGVAPPQFDYPNKTVIWKPGAFTRGNDGWVAVGRLKPDISLGRAQAAFATEASLERRGANNANPLPKMVLLRDALLGPVKDASLLLMGAVVLVLLIACTNLANLLMARTTERSAELSVRAALGASRARLARQLLTECLLLALVAAVTGLLVAFWTTSLAAKVEPPPLGAQSYSTLSWPVLIFTVLASVVTAVVFGLLPALYVTRKNSFGARGYTRSRRSRAVHGGLAVAQVVLTMILLAAAVSVGTAFAHLMRTDRGYDVRGIATISVSLGGTTHQVTHQGDGKELAYFEQVLDRIRNLPGVRSVSATEFLPLYATTFIGGPFGIDGHRASRASMMVPVFSDYFRTMGGRILFGREFTDAEVRSGAKVAIVDEQFARNFGSPADAIGRQLTIGGAPRFVPAGSKIVGVVKAMDYEADPAVANEFQVFMPSANPAFSSVTFVARVGGREEDHLAAIRDTIRSVDPQVPVYSVETMQQRLDDAFARPSFYRTAIWIFAGFALLLTMIGVYGLLAYGVAHRTNEIGIRMALGATRGSLMRMVLQEALLMVSIGLTTGVPLVFFTRTVAATLIGNPPTSLAEPITVGGAAIIAAALLAAYLPARRAMRVDPMVALRHE